LRFDAAGDSGDDHALFKNLIAGEWVEGVTTSRNINPSNTDDVVGEYAGASAVQAAQAIAAARDVFSAWSRTTAQARAEAGLVMINLPTAGLDYHVPFGGRKASSYGPREQGSYAAEFFTIVKTCYVNP